MARPNKYQEWLTEDGLKRIEGWARDGLTEEQIAKNMGICYETLRTWKSSFSAISEAIKRGKAPVDFEVESALLKRARGYEYEETTTEIYEMPDGTKRKHVKKTMRQVVPDVTAQIYWLNNRRPDRWRNRKAVENDQPSVALEKAREILGGVRSAID
ncbi:MAG: helix-turn-helix domain-containing protein [Clostridia bacterium]|nr:helix-turn-helix domain-containing protein [Clostridia bacterium]